jgi:hypothetical protein
MNNSFEKVRDYLLELEYNIVEDNTADSVFVIEKEEEGIANMMVACDDPILIFEQFVFQIKADSTDIFKRLLQMNREIIHGALVLDETGTKVIFRDTLQLENLDLNEISGSLNSLGIFLSEFGEELIDLSK